MCMIMALMAIFGLAMPEQAHALVMADYYGRSLLLDMPNSEGLLYAYDQLVEGVEQSLAEIAVKDETHSLTVDELTMVYDLYRFDHAEHFWLGQTYQYAHHVEQDRDVATKFIPSYIMQGQALADAKVAFGAKIDEILATVPEGMGAYAIEKHLHDTLTGMTAYVIDAPNAHNAYGALVEGQAVCEGYAKAFQCLLQRSDIQSFIVTGWSRGVGHAWNIVRINGKYYHTDPTWADQESEVYYSYFNVPTSKISLDHDIAPTVYPLPECTSEEASYQTKEGYTLPSDYATQPDITDRLGEKLQASDFRLRLFYDGDSTAFINWIDSHIVDIATAAGVSGGFQYGYTTLSSEYIIFIQKDCTHEYDNENDETCNLCGEVSHHYIWVVDTPPTEDSFGVCHEECRICHTTRHENTQIDKLVHAEHMIFHPASPATCQSEGHIAYYTCTNCNRHYLDKVGMVEPDSIIIPVDANSHTGGTRTEGYQAGSAEQDGYTGDVYCEGCGAKLSQGSPIHIHAAKDTLYQTNETMHWQLCRCGEMVNLANHAWDEGREVTAATMYAEGERQFSCDCGATLAEPIPKLKPTTKGEALAFPLPDFHSQMTGVEVDGVVLDATCYTLSADGKTIHLTSDYLATLAKGEHNIRLRFGEDTLEATFETEIPQNPLLALGIPQEYVVIGGVLLLAVVLLAILIGRAKKR